jgi:geranylgeranyl pyrophosphate synthase
VALQIHRDVRDLWGAARDGTPAGDILNKKKSLPVIHALEHAEVHARRELGSLYLQRVLDPKNLPRIIEVLEAAGSRHHCHQLVQQAQEEALHALAVAGIAEAATAEFQEVAAFLLDEGA